MDGIEYIEYPIERWNMIDIVRCDTCNGERILYQGYERKFRLNKWVVYIKFWCFNCEATFQVRAKQGAEKHLVK